MRKLIPLFILIVLPFRFIVAQNNYPVNIRLEKFEIRDFPEVQSHTFATWDNKWILIGGRTDGLHRRQPFAAFNEAGMNKFIYLVDIKNEKVIKQGLSSLPAALAEQLQSSNMQFYQDNSWLILTGGYGFSPSTKKFLTHPFITFVNIPLLIQSIENNSPINESFFQTHDENFAVTGGRLLKLAEVYYLAGGQLFNGRYNPHGPDHGPGFIQLYTNAIRRFTVSYNSKSPAFNKLTEWHDSVLLHRRDYNLIPQRNNSGKNYLTIFSGVFQYNKDIPFTNLVDINNTGYREVLSFEQQFNHYHTATLPLYLQLSGSMLNIFFGGIAQKYISEKGDTVIDNNVPFVKSISVIERNDEKIKEYILPVSMPGYFGASAEFIPANKKYFSNGVLVLKRKPKKPFLAGYITGGINSSGKNIFWENTGEESDASGIIWKVIIE